MLCPKCGNSVENGDLFCGECGYKFESKVDIEIEKYTSLQNVIKLVHPVIQWIFFAALVLIVFLCTFFAAYHESYEMSDYVIGTMLFSCITSSIAFISSMWNINKFYNIEKRIIELSEFIKKGK